MPEARERAIAEVRMVLSKQLRGEITQFSGEHPIRLAMHKINGFSPSELDTTRRNQVGIKGSRKGSQMSKR
jgi:hypothetical protein